MRGVHWIEGFGGYLSFLLKGRRGSVHPQQGNHHGIKKRMEQLKTAAKNSPISIQEAN